MANARCACYSSVETPGSLEEQGRNKCFSHAINNVARKDVVKVVLWVLPGGMFSFFLSFFFFPPLLPSSPSSPRPPLPRLYSVRYRMPPTRDQRKTALFQGKEKIKLLKLNKSIPVEKRQRGGEVWPSQALGSDLGTERENLPDKAQCHSCWQGLGVERTYHWQGELPEKGGWG